MEFNRRVSDKPIEERVGILEEKVFTQGQQDTETVQLVKDLSNKLVYHIQEEGSRDAKIAAKVDYIECTVKESNENISSLTKMATKSKEDLIEWHAVLKTMARIISATIIIVSGMWAIFTYFDKHNTHIEIVQGQDK